MVFRILILIISITPFLSLAQVMMDIEGAITLQNTQNGNPEPGTIRWTGSDFEGWNGLAWVSLTGGKQVGEVMDINGNVYKTVKIGEQVWMAENLNVSKLNDGTVITKPGQITLPGAIQGRYYYGDNESQYGTEFGALYTWEAVTTSKLCPIGWHLPSSAEWTVMEDFLGGDLVAGGKLKSKGTWSLGGGSGPWSWPNTGATNTFGFTAISGGSRLSDGTYSELYEKGHYWTSTPNNPIPAIHTKILSFDSAAIIFGSAQFINSAASVRCVKN